ncbi:MAG: class I tRNA ligase family protein, partial [Planctomycetota bacterium]
PKSEYATGFLKVTPGHDPNDWDIGQRHDLPVINMLGPDGTVQVGEGWDDVSADARAFVGLSREDAREAVVRWFRDHDLLQEIRPYRHSVGHSYRSHVPIEPYLSDQWYVRVTDGRLRGEALRAMSHAQHEGAPPAREAGPATAEGDGKLTFFPARYARTFQTWHENLRDWCISRQLWWGHRIPVWTLDEAAGPVAARWEGLAAAEPDRLVARRNDERLHLCFAADGDELAAQADSDGFRQDPDVLDTWFSSALWPLSTMGWPAPADHAEMNGLLEDFNPSSVLCTARDIITLWVSRMVMFNRHFRDGVLPFRHVYIHPMIQDGHGQRMSKSLGNGVDPRDIIHSHGADAMRFTLCRMATTTQDVRLPVDMICPHCEHAFHPKEATSPAGYRVAAPRQECPSCRKPMVSGYGVASGAAQPEDGAPLARNTSSKFDEGRNFANKLWNATRFALRNLPAEAAGIDRLPDVGELALVDRWIVSRLHQTLHAVEDALGEYQFNVYADAMYQFVWGDFCDWYLEAVKPTVADSPVQQQVLRSTMNAIMRMLHPICPFVTETLWPHVAQRGRAGLDGVTLSPAEVLAAAAWPDVACRVHDDEALRDFGRVQALVEAVRAIRGNTRKALTLLVPEELLAVTRAASQAVQTLAGLESIEGLGAERPEDAVPVPFEGRELLLVGLAGHVDRDAERERLRKLVAEKEAAVEGFRRRLDNAGYVSKAPPAVVQETRDRLAQAEADLAAARRALEAC